MIGERDLLVVLLTQLQDARDGRHAEAGRDEAIKACRRALDWIEMRQDGRAAFNWIRPGIARNFVIGTTLMVALRALAGPLPLTMGRALAFLAIVVVFGLGGGVFVSYVAWRSREDDFQQQLAAATSALRNSKAQTLPGPPSAPAAT